MRRIAERNECIVRCAGQYGGIHEEIDDNIIARVVWPAACPLHIIRNTCALARLRMRLWEITIFHRTHTFEMPRIWFA